MTQIIHKPKTIGFFGDSYCGCYGKDKRPFFNDFFKANPFYKTYLQQVTEHYNLECVNFGKGGSSIWDSILLQIKPFIDTNTIPDICVFIWTSKDRVFNRNRYFSNLSGAIRWLEVYNESSDEITLKKAEAVKMYYEYIYDKECACFQYETALYYFDNVILSQFPSTTKIIHMWSFGDGVKNDGKDLYPMRWKNGLEINPFLHKISTKDALKIEDIMCAPNHFSLQKSNDTVYSWLVKAIDEYESGKLLDFNI
jgi:hypothetical protein